MCPLISMIQFSVALSILLTSGYLCFLAPLTSLNSLTTFLVSLLSIHSLCSFTFYPSSPENYLKIFLFMGYLIFSVYLSFQVDILFTVT